MEHVVIVVDVSIAMAMRDLRDGALEVARSIANAVDRSTDHQLAAVIAVSSSARLLGRSDLARATWDSDHGIDIEGALALARHEVGDGPGRVVLISSLDFHHRHLDGTYIAIATPESLADGREALARWLDAGLRIDLLLCSSDQGRVHGDRIRNLFARSGAALVDLAGGSDAVDAYLAETLAAEGQRQLDPA